MADGEQNLFGLIAAVGLGKTSGESLFLLWRLQAGKKQRMAYADFVPVERFDRRRDEVNQLEAGCHERSGFARFRGDLLNAVLWLVQIEQRPEAVEVSSNYTRTIG
jgi:hypothetical protein